MPEKRCAAEKPARRFVWKVFLDTEYGNYIACQPSINPSFTASKGSKLRYIEVAAFPDETDAKDYAHTKNLGKPADILDFVLLEHEIMERSRPLTQEEATELQNLVQSVQDVTGRKCFGKCHTMSGRPACRTCYSNRNATWRMCADITCLDKLKKLTSHKRSRGNQ